MNRIHLLYLLSLALIATAELQAQTSSATAPLIAHSPAVEASSPDSRLRQLEGIYQQQLRARHIPLLGKYLTDLQQNARLSDTPALQTDIQRVQTLISAGGLIDLAAAARELNPGTEAIAGVPMMPPSGKLRRTPITLTPSFAQSILPQPEESASPVAAKIGQMSWRIDHLPAGSYDFVLHFASLTPEAAVPLRIEFAGQKLEQNITATQATKDARTFRLLRIGQMKLEQDIHGTMLTLSAATAEAPGLLVRHLVIARAKE
jgi:hypothetical protein